MLGSGRIFALVVLVTQALVWAGCAPSQAKLAVAPASRPAAARNYYAEAVAALKQNNYVDAYALVRNAPDGSPDAVKARALAKELQPKVDKISHRVLLKADEAVALGFAARAVQLLTEAARLPLATDKRADVDKRLAAAKDQLVKLRKEYDERLQKGRDALARGDAGEAYRSYARASDLAEDQKFPWTFVEDQQLELARADLPASAKTGSRRADYRKKHRAAASPVEAEAIVGAVDTFATQEQEISRLKSVRDLVERARDYKKKNMQYEAIVTLEEARRKDPDSAAVKLLLDTLDEERSRLIDEYLEIADRHFAKQDLEAAMPYFRRVLRLENDNLRAREALKMYDNLERIRQERSDAR